MHAQTFLAPHVLHSRSARSTTSSRLPLSLHGYHPGYNPDSEDSSMSDDSGEIIPPLSSRSGSSFSSFSSTSLPQDKYRYLLHANRKLEIDNLVLKGQLNVLQDAYSRLLATIGSHDVPSDESQSTNTLGLSVVKQEMPLPVLSALPEAEREDFPLVKYWSRYEWSASEDLRVASIGVPGKARAVQGENVSMKFVEDENGNIIDGYRASSIHKFARSLWAGLSNAGKAPESWGKVDAQTSSQFQIEMCRNFPELRLCKGNWKVDLIATMNYPSWYSNQVKEKEENRKRASTGPVPDPKRLKPAPDSSSAIHAASKKKRTCRSSDR